ncbi:hypothetical protein JTE90_007366 [Oedothorax gibbosus]|uniref:Sialin n=1 Tax=Oedothorax gibbosus TaxID=931172 RepID=A0AAV6U7P3_9ARAC|nr:hypothetical protein JTE90_007366 [Oedothorax gibbosus]
MEIQPDFDAGEVARTVAVAVSSLHNRAVSSDNDDTPLIPKDSSSVNADPNHKRGRGLPCRYVLSLLGFLGFCNVYALRVNLSVALVAMVDHTAPNATPGGEECRPHNHTPHTLLRQGEFPWGAETQATILGAFFYGYMVTQIPGGRLAERGGGKWLFGGGVLATSLLTLLTPAAAHWGGASALVALRVLEGLGEGVTFPAMHAMLGAWLPEGERSRLATLVYSGAQIGTVLALPLSGLLCDSPAGWPAVFYVFGALGCAWFVAWAALVHARPELHPRISPEELLLIRAPIERPQVPPLPWRRVLSSVPVWALVVTHFGQNWGFYTFLTELPTYLSSILHFDIKSDGFLSALPYLLQAVVGWLTSFAADWVRRKQYATVSTIRKVSNSIGFFGPAVCLCGVAWAGCSPGPSVLFLTLAMGFNGATYSGYMVTHVDMAPHYAGTLMGMTNCFATIAGFLAPKVVGALTESKETLAQWRIVFGIAIAVYVVTGILFVVCGSAKLQKWGDPKDKSED